MKTYIYKAFLLLLCFTLLFSVVGCGSEEVVPEKDKTLGVEQLSTGIEFTPQASNNGLDVVAEKLNLYKAHSYLLINIDNISYLEKNFIIFSSMVSSGKQCMVYVCCIFLIYTDLHMFQYMQKK